MEVERRKNWKPKPKQETMDKPVFQLKNPRGI